MTYETELETQNHELQERLAETEKTLDMHMKVVQFLTPQWQEYRSFVSDALNPHDSLDGVYYLFKTPISHIAKVFWSTDTKVWIVEGYSDHIAMSKFTCDTLDQARNYIENYYTRTILKLNSP